MHDFEGRFIDANDAALKLLGYGKEEVASLNFANLLTEEQLPLALRLLVELKDTGSQLERTELRLRRKDGSLVSVETNESVIFRDGRPSYCLGIGRDITERKKAEKELVRSEERYRTILERMQDSYYEVDTAGNYTFVSESAGHSLGYSREEMLGQNYRLTVYEEDTKSVLAAFNEVYRTGKPNKGFSHRIRHKDGRIIFSEVSIDLNRNKAGEITGFNCVSRDITERNKAQEELKQSYEALQKAMLGTVQAISMISEVRDPYTAGHQLQVGRLAAAIATELGLPEKKITALQMAGTLHDIGKINVPSEILSKPGRLNRIEFDLIKTHPVIGREILKSIDFPWPICRIVSQHHERLDGSGYPSNLKDDEICIEAKILAVADVVSAMSCHRPYRPALGVDQALEEITAHRGILYDPASVDACYKLFKEKGFQLEG